MHQQVPLQPSLQAGRQSGCRGVGQQSQLVENPSAKVVRNHREAVIRALELEGTKSQSYSPYLLTEKETNPLARHGPCGTDGGAHDEINSGPQEHFLRSKLLLYLSKPPRPTAFNLLLPT